MSSFQDSLQLLLTDRHSPEARGFFEPLLKYVGERVRSVWSFRYRNLLAEAEVEEVVSEVGLQLVMGALCRFRGETLAELMAYVRTIADRTLGLSARRKLRERNTLQGTDADVIREWQGGTPHPEHAAESVHACPLDPKDQEYLLSLLQAGSKAEYARLHNQSRAAVTRMVQRIQGRIETLPHVERDAVDVWMHQAARATLLN